MKSVSAYPTLRQTIAWTAVFYAGFGIVAGVLGWMLNSASENMLLGLLWVNIPLWATGWLFLLGSVPTFTLFGAGGGIIVYRPVRASEKVLRIRQAFIY